MSKAFDKLQPYLDKSMALQTARNLFEWDNQTAAPFEAADNTSKVVGILADEYMKSMVNDDVRKLLKKLQEEKEQEELSETEKAIVKELAKTYEQLESIPPEEYRAFNELAAVSNRKWTKAKKDNRYEDFAPYLKKNTDFRRNRQRGYRLGHAWSDDLAMWHRDDAAGGLALSDDGWDSEMMCYPHAFRIGADVFLLYNGNAFGRHGFGLAQLIQD
jgi:Zn-dependent M32 family carboxypeptidase